MVRSNFKQIDLLRNRRNSNYFLVEPSFINKKKYIKKGIFSGAIMILITLILGIPFVLRTRFLENKKSKIKIFIFIKINGDLCFNPFWFLIINRT